MALLNDDALETGENVYKIASERSERGRFFKYISALKTYDSSQISIYTLLINHCLSVQYVHDCVRNTRDMVLFIILTRKKKLEKNYIERAKICVLLRRKNVLHTDQKLEIKLL